MKIATPQVAYRVRDRRTFFESVCAFLPTGWEPPILIVFKWACPGSWGGLEYVTAKDTAAAAAPIFADVLCSLTVPWYGERAALERSMC